jgi:hypothetical protein
VLPRAHCGPVLQRAPAASSQSVVHIRTRCGALSINELRLSRINSPTARAARIPQETRRETLSLAPNPLSWRWRRCARATSAAAGVRIASLSRTVPFVTPLHSTHFVYLAPLVKHLTVGTTSRHPVFTA